MERRRKNEMISPFVQDENVSPRRDVCSQD